MNIVSIILQRRQRVKEPQSPSHLACSHRNLGPKTKSCLEREAFIAYDEISITFMAGRSYVSEVH